MTNDAVVIGAGHNGLVAAIRLAAAGWKVLVLERSPHAGGAVLSQELTQPGYVHDVFSMNHNLFLASPFYADHARDLERHGLSYATSDQPFANAFPDAEPLRAFQDVAKTADSLADPADAHGWRALDELFERLSPLLFELYAAPVPSRTDLRAGASLGRTMAGRRRDLPELARLLASSPRDLGELYLHSPQARAALACWGMHLDFGPDVSGGAMFPFLEVFSDQRAGMAIPRGGASRMADALVALLRELGGEVRTEAEVVAIDTPAGRAGGVTLAGGERVGARRAVVACVTPGALSGLLGDRDPQLRRQAERYRHGPGTMMIHLALDGPIPWAAGEDLSRFAYVHVAPYVDDLARTYTAALAGQLPAEPLLVVGQPTAFDPTRAPDGGHVAWIQVRTLPSQPAGDEAGELDAAGGDWDALAQPYAERVLAKLEAYAPGVRQRIVDQAVMTPRDLERRNPNLVGGDSLAGSMHLRQNFVLRPRSRTPVEGLWLTGAATWPGAGLNALSGDHTARAVLAAADGSPWARLAGRRQARR